MSKKKMYGIDCAKEMIELGEDRKITGLINKGLFDKEALLFILVKGETSARMEITKKYECSELFDSFEELLLNGTEGFVRDWEDELLVGWACKTLYFKNSEEVDSFFDKLLSNYDSFYTRRIVSVFYCYPLTSRALPAIKKDVYLECAPKMVEGISKCLSENETDNKLFILRKVLRFFRYLNQDTLDKILYTLYGDNEEEIAKAYKNEINYLLTQRPITTLLLDGEVETFLEHIEMLKGNSGIKSYSENSVSNFIEGLCYTTMTSSAEKRKKRYAILRKLYPFIREEALKPVQEGGFKGETSIIMLLAFEKDEAVINKWFNYLVKKRWASNLFPLITKVISSYKEVCKDEPLNITPHIIKRNHELVNDMNDIVLDKKINGVEEAIAFFEEILSERLEFLPPITSNIFYNENIDFSELTVQEYEKYINMFKRPFRSYFKDEKVPYALIKRLEGVMSDNHLRQSLYKLNAEEALDLMENSSRLSSDRKKELLEIIIQGKESTNEQIAKAVKLQDKITPLCLISAIEGMEGHKNIKDILTYL